MEKDLDFEPDGEFGDVEAMQAKIAKLRQELKEAQKKRDEYLDGWQRCKADSINTKKDAEVRAVRLSEVLREGLVHDIIPALDSFDMATQSEAWANVGDSWKSGMELVREQLLSALKRHGIERFGKIGESIDNSRHEIIEERDDVAGIPGTVARILRYGYKTGDRILRPAHVIAKK